MIGIIIGSVFGGLLILFLVALYCVYRYMYYSPKKGQNNEHRIEPAMNYQGTEAKLHELINEIQAIPYEDIWIKSKDGLKLHGYFYKNVELNEFVLMFNGYRGTARSNFAGSAVDLINMKKNVILCEQRAHGQSEGHSITFGRKEQYDVVSWINFVQEKWGKSVKITIAGISMGGATVLLASDKIDPNIKIIADCPYSSQKDVIIHTMKRMKISKAWPLAYFSALIYCHVRLKDDALINVSNSKNKILIIHGTTDSIVPHEMSERFYLKNKDHVRYEKFEGVEHGLSYIRDMERYRRTVKEFLNE